MEMEKVQYTPEDIKRMGRNGVELRDLCSAQDPAAFDQVASRCGDLEAVLPEAGKELKEKSLKEKEKYLRTKDPSCFANLINDIEELYGRAFKLMIENFQSRNKNRDRGPGASTMSSSSASFSSTTESYENVKAQAENVAEEASTKNEQNARARAEEAERTRAVKGSTKGSTVQRVSLSDLQREQGQLGGDNDPSDYERQRMEAYDRKRAARMEEKGRSESAPAQEQGMAMEPPSKKK